MSQIYTLRTQMYFRSSLLSTQNLRKATTWNTSMCLQARSKELKCYCCCIFVSIHDSSCWYVPFYMHCRKFSVLSFCRRRQLIFHDTTMVTPWNNVWGGVYKRKLTPAWVSYRDDFLISYRVYMMTGSFHISLFKGTLHVDKIHVWFKIANITHALPVPVYRQTDFTPKRVAVSRLHDTAARFRTKVKFSTRYKNRGELTPA